ncbi:NAD(P)/FAD-dependent oxidoreductase [Humibacter ginsenosidimutans]|uniref:Ferredoxin reductase n=1 Tax=Humibacter ginsenosidimutans TaxID=2599293 RepID=A0A5B8M0Y4_9MICO|nr:FAD-dependent oxidoreductase [Humibacter ginsenosidimutans]QDZ13599.1 ferredoxin reductase [Humibacter ginsenosidimutans]
MTLDHIVVAGGSIAAVTAAGALRTAGFGGRVTLVSAERAAPYSRVPLSKGVMIGTETPESAALPALPDDVELMLGTAAAGLRVDRRELILAGGGVVDYDGLVIATGARARRLAAPGQRGELVVRTLADAEAIAERRADASSAVVVGGGFLGMEVASTLRHHGLEVTVVDMEPPLRRLLGPWLAEYVTKAALEHGVRLVISEGGVVLEGDPISGVRLGNGEFIAGDLVVSAVGDIPNAEWLEGSGLRLANGVVVDERCRVAPAITGAGDVVSREVSPGVFRRTPHWSNAVAQGRAAATSLLDDGASPYVPDHYFWTEQYGLDVKIAGEPPLVGEPDVLAGDLDGREVLLRWSNTDDATTAVVSINYRMPAARLRKMVA